MIVEHTTMRAKPGCFGELLDLLKAERAKTKDPSKERILTSNVTGWYTIVYEVEHENQAELEKYWEDWWAKPETAEFMEKWNQLIDGSGGNVIWDVQE